MNWETIQRPQWSKTTARVCLPEAPFALVLLYMALFSCNIHCGVIRDVKQEKVSLPSRASSACIYRLGEDIQHPLHCGTNYKTLVTHLLGFPFIVLDVSSTLSIKGHQLDRRFLSCKATISPVASMAKVTVKSDPQHNFQD